MRLAQHREPSVRAAAAASLPRAAVKIADWEGGLQFLADRYRVCPNAACLTHTAHRHPQYVQLH